MVETVPNCINKIYKTIGSFSMKIYNPEYIYTYSQLHIRIRCSFQLIELEALFSSSTMIF